jgi:hypothetical protein
LFRASTETAIIAAETLCYLCGSGSATATAAGATAGVTAGGSGSGSGSGIGSGIGSAVLREAYKGDEDEVELRPTTGIEVSFFSIIIIFTSCFALYVTALHCIYVLYVFFSR